MEKKHFLEIIIIMYYIFVYYRYLALDCQFIICHYHFSNKNNQPILQPKIIKK